MWKFANGIDELQQRREFRIFRNCWTSSMTIQMTIGLISVFSLSILAWIHWFKFSPLWRIAWCNVFFFTFAYIPITWKKSLCRALMALSHDMHQQQEIGYICIHAGQSRNLRISGYAAFWWVPFHDDISMFFYASWQLPAEQALLLEAFLSFDTIRACIFAFSIRNHWPSSSPIQMSLTFLTVLNNWRIRKKFTCWRSECKEIKSSRWDIVWTYDKFYEIQSVANWLLPANVRNNSTFFLTL